MAASLRTAVVIPVPEAAPVVDPWRERTCNDKPSIGIPAHVTLVFPFVPAGAVDPAAREALAAIVGAVPRFAFVLHETRRFRETLYLAPEPPEPFVRLTEAIVRRFPAHPPYEGAFDEVVPHVTVAHGGTALLDEADASVRGLLPLDAVAREALVLEEVEPDWGHWHVRARLPLGASDLP